jgi:hypothetical protein
MPEYTPERGFDVFTRKLFALETYINSRTTSISALLLAMFAVINKRLEGVDGSIGDLPVHAYNVLRNNITSDLADMQLDMFEVVSDIRNEQVEAERDFYLMFMALFFPDRAVQDVKLSRLDSIVNSSEMPGYNQPHDDAVYAVAGALMLGWATKALSYGRLNDLNGKQAVEWLTGAQKAVLNSADVFTDMYIRNTESVVAERLFGKTFGYYQWFSIIDTRTTDICISRHLKVFTAGGPVPPAHMRCRSRVVPLPRAVGMSRAPTLRQWFDALPSPVRNRLFTSADIRNMREGDETKFWPMGKNDIRGYTGLFPVVLGENESEA